jgi:hypothetical protein
MNQATSAGAGKMQNRKSEKSKICKIAKLEGRKVANVEKAKAKSQKF